MIPRQKARASGWMSVQGSVLVEVIVGMVILGVFVGGLCDAILISSGAAARVRTEAAALGGSGAESSGATAWSWGPKVDTVEWRPGPELTVRRGEGCHDTVKVGIWSDGWLVGEWPIEGNDAVLLGSEIWVGMSGRELTVRARAEDEAWGPPWRSVVPAADCQTVLMPAAPGQEPSLEGPFFQASSVMHTRWPGAPAVGASWTPTAICRYIEGVVGLLVSAASGECALEFEGRTQQWLNHESRCIDIYW